MKTSKVLKILLFWVFIISCPALGQDVNELRSTIQQNKSDSQTITAYGKLIKYYKSVNIDSAYYYGEKGLQVMVAKRSLIGEAKIIEQLAKIDQSQGRMELAKQRLSYGLKLYSELKDAEGIAAMNNSYGAVEATLGNYETAMPHLLIALRIYDSLKTNLEGTLVANMNLGCLYLQYGDTVNSKKYLARAEAVSKKQPVSDLTISLYNYIGIQYAMTGNMPKALEYFKENVRISDKPEFTTSHVESLNYLGSFYNDMGDTKTAMEYLQQGLAIATEKKLVEGQADILLQMATMLAKTDRVQAMKFIEQALALSEHMRSKTLKRDIYKTMSSIYEQAGDYKESIAALRKYQAIQDSIAHVNMVKEIASMGAVYDLEKSNIRIEEISRQRNVTMTISAGLIAALITLVYFYLKTRKLNVQLVKHEAELIELSNTKNKLFSIIGHDLRWPVARIPTILEIVDDDSMPEEERKYLIDSLREHTKATVETLDKLLYWGQSLMKGLSTVPERFYAKQYIVQAIELRKIAASDKEIVVTDRIPEDLDIFTDPNHFDFIIRNLFGNAIKFTGVKGIIDFSADEHSKPGYVIFAIRDSGVGISAERLKKIFEPFNSNIGTANEKGTGIGLMLCKEFAVKNGGDIWATSEPGKGSTFYVSVKQHG
ncbi:hypothetical protein CJD36_008665 [Flavipsychrobacter stenotrophus]|uniref:histidine kinase n=1 Tax=Flavipsychrobacter stenotrophus TaxID=2077091 RepID=A0A2S7SZB0_9BACT|nr:HAMP domain-containing sensor histidine kinase [Flavipsychrobacter stenotrophus]PQJ11856.1 hypothetical protein CJD36_008665 [Flavipsychrobacter stenotrophus]